MRKYFVIVVFLLGLAAPRGASACSMCRCGDPTFTLVGSQVFVPNMWHVGLDVDRYAKDQVAEDGPGLREKEVDDRLTLSASYGVGQRLTFVGRLPFSNRTISGADGSDSLFGASDPELLTHLRVVSAGPGSWLSATVGVRPGWGQNNRQVNGERAEEHLQPGTGAFGAEAGLSFSRLLGGGDDMSLFGSAVGRVNGRNGAEYHYGNAVVVNLGWEKRLAARVNGVVEVNYRWAARDEPGVGDSDPNTGGSVLYVSPRILLKVRQGLFLRLGIQAPIAKHLYGDQDEKVNILSGLTARF
jgi:hypothetical protein